MHQTNTVSLENAGSYETALLRSVQDVILHVRSMPTSLTLRSHLPVDATVIASGPVERYPAIDARFGRENRVGCFGVKVNG